MIATPDRYPDQRPLSKKEIRRWRKHWHSKLTELRRLHLAAIRDNDHDRWEQLRDAEDIAERKHQYWVLRDINGR